jgi:1-hydroxycarotenoid 3,4-desaturase
MTPRQKVIVVGAGAGGLSAAISAASRGMDVTVLDRAAAPGGKMRTLGVGGRQVDAGPTVLTMRWVFERLFEMAGTSLEARSG